MTTLNVDRVVCVNWATGTRIDGSKATVCRSSAGDWCCDKDKVCGTSRNCINPNDLSSGLIIGILFATILPFLVMVVAIRVWYFRRQRRRMQRVFFPFVVEHRCISNAAVSLPTVLEEMPPPYVAACRAEKIETRLNANDPASTTK